MFAFPRYVLLVVSKYTSRVCIDIHMYNREISVVDQLVRLMTYFHAFPISIQPSIHPFRRVARTCFFFVVKDDWLVCIIWVRVFCTVHDDDHDGWFISFSLL